MKKIGRTYTIALKNHRLRYLKTQIKELNRSNVREGWSESFLNMNQQGGDTLLMPDVFGEDFNEID